MVGEYGVKVDALVTYCDRPMVWAYVYYGLLQNQDSISKIILACDGPPPGIGPTDDFPLEVVEIPKVPGFGVSSAMNAGLARVETPFYLHIDDDILLPKGIVDQMLEIQEKTGVSLLSGYLKTTTDPEEALGAPLSNPFQKLVFSDDYPWHRISGGLHLAETETVRAIGGWNEAMTDYGLQDYEFACRWLFHNKDRSMSIASTIAYHYGDTKASDRTPPLGSVNRQEYKKAIQAWMK